MHVFFYLVSFTLPPVLIRQEAVRAPEAVLTLWIRKIFLAPAENLTLIPRPFNP
jgi:hypothetical protein